MLSACRRAGKPARWVHACHGGCGLTIAKALFKSLPYNIETDFTPVSTTASYGLVITTKAGSPYSTIKDVVAKAKARPGTLTSGPSMPAARKNLSAELFRTMAGLDVTIVPYKTTPDLANAVLRGDVDVALNISPVSRRPSPTTR